MRQTREERLALAHEATLNSAIISGAETDPEQDSFKIHLDLMKSVFGCNTGALTHPLAFNSPLCGHPHLAKYRTGLRATVGGIIPEAKHVRPLLNVWWRMVRRTTPKKRTCSLEERAEYAWQMHDFFVSLEPFAEANARTGRLVYYMLLNALDLEIKIISAEKAKEYAENQRRYRSEVFTPFMRKRGML